MRDILLTTATMLVLTGGFARAASTNDEIFANAALRELHSLAVASAQSERAAKDSDEIGCRDAYESMEKAAHEALVNMHYMSFAPIDAIDHVSTLLRVTHLTPNGCAWELATDTHTLPMLAGQAIMSLRYDYAIGDGDWYMINASGDVEAKNPLRYAQSLKDQNCSWVDVRPKGMLVMVESDWKAEMASHDNNTEVYFYRTKEDALAAAQVVKQHAENDADAILRAFTSLPYMVANHDVGFKLVYGACEPAGKNAKGDDTCNDDSSHDWSDSRSVPYRWFSDIYACGDAQLSIITSIMTKHRADVKVNPDAFVSHCVPASKVSGHTLKGYKMVFALTAPGADDDDATYADLRESASQTARIFKTFNACYDAGDAAYSKTMKDLGADEDGNLLSDKTKSISLRATCVRIY